jgi:tetratricopeptide (TPR) repeat protein
MYEAIVRFQFGEFITVRRLLEKSLGLRDPAHRMAFAGITAEDPYVMTLSWLGPTLAILGYIEQGRARIAEALVAPAQVESAHSRFYSRCFALIFACAPYRIANSHLEAKKYAEELIALSNEHGFPYAAALGYVNAGSALVGLGQYREGLALLTKGLEAQRAMGASIANVLHLAWRAQAYGGLGERELSESSLAEAKAMMEATGARCNEPLLHHTRGDLFLAADDATSATRAYERALTVARRQSARSYELSSATALARLWQHQGKTREARDLLAPVYGWFTEGFDTPLLKEAKALLDELVG